MTEKKKEKVTTRDVVYEGVAKALLEAYDLQEIPRKKEGLLLKLTDENGDEQDVIVRVIQKKDKVEDETKQIFTKD